jgi:hypothetical protein
MLSLKQREHAEFYTLYSKEQKQEQKTKPPTVLETTIKKMSEIKIQTS